MWKIDTDFRALLDGLQVEEAVITKLTTEGCTNTSLFATWVDEVAEVTSILPEDLRQNPAAKSKLKQAWKRAQLVNERVLKRLSEGLSEEQIDEPLAHEVQRDMIKVAAEYYHWGIIDARRIMSDRQMARVRREFQNWQPTLLSLTKVKTLSVSQKAATTSRQRISDEIMISMGNLEEDTSTHLDIVLWPDTLRVLATTWVVCGCYDVPLQEGSQERVNMCSWEDADYYTFEFTNRIPKMRHKYVDSSIIKYVTEVEEHMRSRALEQSRSSQKIPWGKALKNALKSEAHKWQDFREDLISREEQRRPQARFA